jgi:phosphatidylcholine synthase
MAFAGVVAVIEGRFRAAFLWMIAATIVDGTDGVLARLARVKEFTPTFDGARLDDIVDYLTFVFLPILLLYQAGNLPPGWGIAVVAGVLPPKHPTIFSPVSRRTGTSWPCTCTVPRCRPPSMRRFSWR